MKYNPEKRKRRSVRLRDYDYSRQGVYFITICTKNRSHLFGDIDRGKMILSPIGELIKEMWSEIPSRYQGIESDESVIMPNHIHGIINIIENKARRGLINQTPTKWILMRNPAQTLGKIIRYFKARASRIIHKNGYTDFKWQRSYYDRVIRNEKELNAVREYILNNPAKWEFDRENSLSENYGLNHDIYFKDVFGDSELF